MKFRKMRRVAAAWIAGLGLVLPVAIAAAQTTNAPAIGALPAYYFPGPALCTVMIDFGSVHAKLEPLSKDSRDAKLAGRMLHEIAENIAKCGGSQDVRALAVEIPGTDNYGRPNFGARKNLLMIEGSASAVLAKGAGAEIKDVAELKPDFKLTEY